MGKVSATNDKFKKSWEKLFKKISKRNLGDLSWLERWRGKRVLKQLAKKLGWRVTKSTKWGIEVKTKYLPKWLSIDLGEENGNLQSRKESSESNCKCEFSR